MDLNTRVVILLTLISFSLVGLHRTGVMNTYFNVLDTKHLHSYRTSDDGSSNSKLSLHQNFVEMECYIENLNYHRFCELDIMLTNNKTRGLNLSEYKNLIVGVEYITPDTSDNDLPIRIYFRNYNAQYSNLSDVTSSKYNSVQFEPNKQIESSKIPLSALQVSTWWIEQHKIDFNNAQVDLSNVTSVEFSTAYLSDVGTYKIRLNQFQLQGELISEANLLRALLILWLLSTIYLINHQRRILQKISNIDPLTQALNRRGLNAWMQKYFTDKASYSKVCMLYIDIDDFKTINDTYGHLIGDKLLQKFCQITQEEVNLYFEKYKKNTNVLARLSGDEFALVLVNVSDNQIIDIAECLLTRFTKEIFIDDIFLKINASIGIAKGEDIHTATPINLMEHADAAMYHSKNNGKNQFKIYGQDIENTIVLRKKISNALTHAINHNEFSLVFMPIYLNNLEISSVEVLLRSTSSKLKNIGPDQFIPIAEEYGLIKTIDLWVLEETFKLIAQHTELVNKHDLQFCINISSVELTNSAFPSQVEKLLARYQILANQIELEVTETSLINIDENCIDILNQLKTLGVNLSLDDFGTGYTAFNQLVSYPIDTIKIDRTFVGKINNTTESDSTMVDIILGIAQSYQLKVIAEGVETQYQCDYLRKKNCDGLQGYHLSKPIEWCDVIKLLNHQKHLDSVACSTL